MVNMLAPFGAFGEIEAGIARLLAGQGPPPITALRLPMIYLIIDVVLAILLALALWPLRRRWEARLAEGQLHMPWITLRLLWKFGLPVTLLAGARRLLHALGAQSWAEGLLLFLDFGAWLWAFSLLLMLTGVRHQAET
jgi:hypothetical protein